MRLRFSKILLASIGLVVAGQSQAVILYRSATRNIAAPTGTFSNSGWQYQLTAGGFLGTPIGPHTYVTAWHVARDYGVTSFTWNNVNYTLTAPATNITGTDIAICSVDKAFPTWSAVYDPATDGSLIGKTLVVTGRGTQRGAEINLATPPRPGESTLRGWDWGHIDGVQSWGTNVIDGMAPGESGDPHEYLTYSFSANGTSEESSVSIGDSGGGNFVKAPDGVWKLVGTTTGLDGGFSLTGTPDSYFNGAIFDKGNLYQDNTTPIPDYFEDSVADQPILNYASNISNFLSDLAPHIPKPGDATLDGKVNTQDFNQFAGHFGANSSNWADGDFNHDGIVSSIDFTLLINNYGFNGTPPLAPAAGAVGGAVVPEPASVGILLILGGLMLRRSHS